MAVWEGEVIGVGCTLVFLHSCVSSLSSSSWIHVYTGVHMRAHTCIVHRHVHACTYTHTHTHTHTQSALLVTSLENGPLSGLGSQSLD
jgi:hypothetical protein